MNSHRFGAGGGIRRQFPFSVLAVLLAVAGCASGVDQPLAPDASWAAGEPQGPTLERLRAFELPEEIARAQDVRWSADGELLLGRSAGGIYSWWIGEERAELAAVLGPEDLQGLFSETARSGIMRSLGFEDYSLVGGARSRGIVFAGFAHGLFLQDHRGIRLLKDIALVYDIDRRGTLTAALGLAQLYEGPDGGAAWEDHVAWLFEDGGSEPRGLLPTRDQGQSMRRCFGAQLSVVRFVSENRILVVPGAEPGVFVFDDNGTLLESFGAKTFFADEGCDVRSEALLAEVPYRLAWLSRRRVIDEVVSDDAGNVYFFVRHVPGPSDGEEPSFAQRGGRVCWDLVHAHLDDLNDVTKVPCAVESGRTDTRLNADLRDQTAVILLQDAIHQEMGRPSVLFEARVRAPEL